MPVVALEMLTEGRSARDLPKQRSAKKRLWLDIGSGTYKLWALCRDHPGAAVPAARDEAPLRLVLWLSFRLSTRGNGYALFEAHEGSRGFGATSLPVCASD